MHERWWDRGRECHAVIYDLKRQINSTGCLTGPETSWITTKIRRRPGEMLEKWKKNETKRSVVWQNWEEVLKDRLKIWRGKTEIDRSRILGNKRKNKDEDVDIIPGFQISMNWWTHSCQVNHWLPFNLHAPSMSGSGSTPFYLHGDVRPSYEGKEIYLKLNFQNHLIQHILESKENN